MKKPVRLQRRAPACFDSQAQWNEYRAAAEAEAGEGFTYCSDCTPQRQARMDARGRCAHPTVRFVQVNGAYQGRRE